MVASGSSLLRLWFYAFLVGILVFAILIAVGFLYPSWLLPCWGIAGIGVIAVSYFLGLWPVGEPMGTYLFMCFAYLILPPLWAAFAAFQYLNHYHVSQQPS
jgi:hypothetical protein